MPPMNPKSFGAHLKALRNATGLTLRQVEEQTEGRVKNGYLSQIENGAITLVSPGVLWELAEVYRSPWRDLVERAGHRLPAAEAVEASSQVIAGLPLRALEDLDEDDRQALVDFLGYLRAKRKKP